MTPSQFGDLAYQITHVQPLGTATGRWYFKTSGTDTGTILTTSRAIDLSRALHLGATGGKPLDTTVHAGAVAAPPRFKSLTLAIPMKLGVKLGGKGQNVFITVAHKTSTAAGGTYTTLKTTVHRFKVGTSTAQVHHVGVASSVNTQGMRKFYKANITIAFRKASSTAAKDTTTGGAPFTMMNPAVILSGADIPAFVPVQVS